MSGTATPVHYSNECNIPFKEEADELNMLTRYFPSQYLMCHYLRATGAHAKTLPEETVNQKANEVGYSCRELGCSHHTRIMAECLVCEICKAADGQRPV